MHSTRLTTRPGRVKPCSPIGGWIASGRFMCLAKTRRAGGGQGGSSMPITLSVIRNRQKRRCGQPLPGGNGQGLEPAQRTERPGARGQELSGLGILPSPRGPSPARGAAAAIVSPPRGVASGGVDLDQRGRGGLQQLAVVEGLVNRQGVAGGVDLDQRVDLDQLISRRPRPSPARPGRGHDQSRASTSTRALTSTSSAAAIAGNGINPLASSMPCNASG